MTSNRTPTQQTKANLIAENADLWEQVHMLQTAVGDLEEELAAAKHREEEARHSCRHNTSPS